MKSYLVEFIGTFFLTFVIAVTGQPLAIGLILASMIYMGGHISGAHYNPAITLALWWRGAVKICCVPFYMLAQLLGAFAAAALVKLLSGKLFALGPAADLASWKVVLVEGLFTFVLCAVVLVMMTSKKFKNNTIYGLAIGLTLTAITFAGGGAFKS